MGAKELCAVVEIDRLELKRLSGLAELIRSTEDPLLIRVDTLGQCRVALARMKAKEFLGPLWTNAEGKCYTESDIEIPVTIIGVSPTGEVFWKFIIQNEEITTGMVPIRDLGGDDYD